MGTEDVMIDCSKCGSEEAGPNLQDCLMCDNLIDGCTDCYGAHIDSHTQDEIDTAFFKFYCPDVENSLPFVPLNWYDLN